MLAPFRKAKTLSNQRKGDLALCRPWQKRRYRVHKGIRKISKKTRKIALSTKEGAERNPLKI